jgi:hypothetical protein
MTFIHAAIDLADTARAAAAAVAHLRANGV